MRSYDLGRKHLVAGAPLARTWVDHAQLVHIRGMRIDLGLTQGEAALVTGLSVGTYRRAELGFRTTQRVYDAIVHAFARLQERAS